MDRKRQGWRKPTDVLCTFAMRKPMIVNMAVISHTSPKIMKAKMIFDAWYKAYNRTWSITWKGSGMTERNQGQRTHAGSGTIQKYGDMIGQGNRFRLGKGETERRDDIIDIYPQLCRVVRFEGSINLSRARTTRETHYCHVISHGKRKQMSSSRVTYFLSLTYPSNESYGKISKYSHAEAINIPYWWYSS